MSFHNDLFPETVSRGSATGPGFRTSVQKLDGGAENRVGLWSGARHRYNMAKGIRTPEELHAVKEFYMARQGALHSFPVKDPLDHTSNPTDPSYRNAAGTQDQPCSPSQGDGSNTTFQLVKSYTSGAITLSRPITKPTSGTISVWVNSVLQTETTHYTLDYSTGVLTFLVAIADTHDVEWSGNFHVEGRFEEQTDEWLQASVDGFDYSSIPSIGVIEITNTDPGYTHEQFFGGSHEQDLAGVLVLSLAQAHFYGINTTGVDGAVKLPVSTSHPQGGPIFTIMNTSGSIDLDVQDEDGTVLATLGPAEAVFAYCVKSTAGGTPAWFLLGDV